MITRFLKGTHPEWHSVLNDALEAMDESYLQQLDKRADYLPKRDALFAAFGRPLSSTRTILFGESPYPRAASANGHAFWDASVGALWSDTGLSKAVNRATSLRNLIKMLLYARGDLSKDFSQGAIAALDKAHYHPTLDALFEGLIAQGFMLLNASLVYEKDNVPYHARKWAPFMGVLLDKLATERPDIMLVLLGRIAEKIPGHERFNGLRAEHPYNVSFITNPTVVNWFKPMDLLHHDNRK
ncbi:MAG: uracil-DNA glycosylase [Legionellaceae bacterium]|nr:uracil-DNA glycosylase [Legionellaceae bacterium]